MSCGVLIVDDDSEFRSELAEMLEGYEVVEAGGGEEALSILSSPNNIEVVLLDIRMPGIDGLETLKKIKALEPETGVIILTGFSTKDAAVEALRNRADDYLEKPAGIDNVRETVERVLPRGQLRGMEAPGDPSLRPGKVRRFLEKNRRRKVTLSDAAEQVFLSPKYLSRYFKEETGRGFRDYKMELKLKEAKKLLAGSGMSVGSVSEKLGYRNAESFSRIFKKREGLSPSEFRKSSGTEKR